MTSDPTGISGQIFHLTAVLFLMSSTLLVFLYLWRKGRLDMDEEAKFLMMGESDE